MDSHPAQLHKALRRAGRSRAAPYRIEPRRRTAQAAGFSDSHGVLGTSQALDDPAGAVATRIHMDVDPCGAVAHLDHVPVLRLDHDAVLVEGDPRLVDHRFCVSGMSGCFVLAMLQK
jgi:hypothetical protein